MDDDSEQKDEMDFDPRHAKVRKDDDEEVDVEVPVVLGEEDPLVDADTVSLEDLEDEESGVLPEDLYDDVDADDLL